MRIPFWISSWISFRIPVWIPVLLFTACGGGGGGLAPVATLQGVPGGLPVGDLVAPATVELDPASLTGTQELASLLWDWGDGSAAETGASDASAVHVYTQAGVFTLRVTGVFRDGQRADLSFPVRVRDPAGVITTFETGKTPEFEIHVATTGDDTTGDGSAALPYESIARGAGDLAPGGALRVHAGTYAGGTFLTDLAGTADAPIWIGGAPGEARPVIDGGGEGLHLTRVRYLVLHDLEVTGAANNGINCDDGGDYANRDATRYVVFRDLSIHDIGTGGNQDGLKLSGVDDYLVLDCVIERTSASGIDQVGCHAGLIARCRFQETGSNAIQCKGGTSDLEIKWCTLIEPGPRGINIGGSTGKQYFRPPLSTTQPNFEARNVAVLGNLIRGGDAAFAFVGAVDCVVAQNTIVQPHNWLFRILQETTSDATHEFIESRDCEVTNNLFHFERADLSTYVNIGAGTQPGTFTYRNNLWYAYDDPARSQPSQITTGTGGVIGRDPGLADPPGDDISLATDSPARGAGAIQSWIALGIGGGPFPSPPNIGAHE